MKINAFDSNVHSNNSYNGRSPVLSYVDKALEYGLIGFSVTDHFECGADNINDQTQSIKQSVFETELAENAARYKISITKGIELGEPHIYEEEAKKILELTKFDFVLGAIHKLSDGTDLCFTDFDDPNVVVADIMERYFLDCVELSKNTIYDSFAHLCYPERFIWGRSRIPFHIDQYSDYIDEILKNIITNGKALEINTYGLRTSMAATSPHYDIIKRYKDMGGELITFGSNAHNSEDLGYGFDLVAEKMLALGIKYFTVYRRREPLMLKIL